MCGGQPVFGVILTVRFSFLGTFLPTTEFDEFLSVVYFLGNQKRRFSITPFLRGVKTNQGVCAFLARAYVWSHHFLSPVSIVWGKVNQEFGYFFDIE